MRTTFNIDDDVMAAVREIANRERVSAGESVSRLLRRALVADVTTAVATLPLKKQNLQMGFTRFRRAIKL